MPHRSAARLSGLLTAILTPFDSHGDLALEHLPGLIAFQRAAGVDGLVVCGTNGESASMSAGERMRTVDTAMAHHGDMTVIAGTGAASVTDAVALSRHAADAGADAILVLPPFFFKQPPVQGVASYFRSVLDAVDLPVLLYSIPQVTAVPITDELVEALADHPNLSGIKDSAGDWTRTHALIRRFPELRIFAGSDRLAARCYANGGAGAISGGANAFPEVVAAVRNAFNSHGASVETDAAQARLDALAEITGRYPLLTTSKAILPHRGLPRLGMRPPLVPLSAPEEERLIRELGSAGFLP